MKIGIGSGNITDAGIVIVQDNRAVYINPAAEKISGYSRDESGSVDFFDLFVSEKRDRVRERLEKQLKGVAVMPWKEIDILTKAGDKKWLSYTTTRIEFDGKPESVTVLWSRTSTWEFWWRKTRRSCLPIVPYQ